MSFALKSIELQNITAHDYLLFEPAIEGITAISGDNGAGKSTIVDAFAWGLYGTRPSGIRNKNLIRDGVDPKTKPVMVRSVIISGGVEYSIERKIITANGAVECNVWGKKTGSDKYKQIAGPGVSHVEKFIRNELGMNEKGFLTSVFIQQKQVDQIVSASPRERGAVIEELTGIASITQAIQKTNENTRNLEKTSSVFRIEDIDEVRDKVSNQEDICKDIKQKEKLAISNFNEMKDVYKISKDNYEKQVVKVKKRRDLNNEIHGINRQIDFLKKQNEDDIKFIEKYEDKYSLEEYNDTSVNKKAVADKRTEVYEVRSKTSNINKELNTLQKNINKCVSSRKGYESSDEANRQLKSLEKDLSDTSSKLNDSENQEIVFASEIKHSKASHEHMRGDDTNCPVCKADIKDPEELIRDIENDISKFKTRLNKTKENSKDLCLKVNSIKKDIEIVELAITAIDTERELRSKHENLNNQLEELSLEGKTLTDSLSKLEVEYDKSLRFEADKTALIAAKDRSSTVNTTINTDQKEVDKALEFISELNSLSDEDLNTLMLEVRHEQDELTKLSIAVKEIRGRKELEQERLGDYRESLTRVEESLEQYNIIAKQIEVSAASASVLTAFKADRIENAIPTLEFFASDFLSKFTGGTFMKLTVDKKFNTFVTTADDVIRPVAQLSGGELSSAAIALRLGIAMLLNSSEKNVLILDEVLVSMDEDRSRQIMETIGSMTNSQVIFIAHNNDINSVADKTVLVSKS